VLIDISQKILVQYGEKLDTIIELNNTGLEKLDAILNHPSV
jgi:hypothetical protein